MIHDAHPTRLPNYSLCEALHIEWESARTGHQARCTISNRVVLFPKSFGRDAKHNLYLNAARETLEPFLTATTMERITDKAGVRAMTHPLVRLRLKIFQLRARLTHKQTAITELFLMSPGDIYIQYQFAPICENTVEAFLSARVRKHCAARKEC